MVAPDQPRHIIGQTNDSDAHQRRRRKVESGHAIRAHQGFKAVLLFGLVELAPVVQLKRNRDLAMYDLKGDLLTFPTKRRSQNLVMVDDGLPSVFQQSNI